MKPKLKICGVADAAFAAEAVRLGADVIGVIFAPQSPRRVTLETARAVAAAARREGAVRIAGVFAGNPFEEMLDMAAKTPLDIVQLHGGYSDEAVAAAKRAGYETWRLDEKREGGAEDAVIIDGRRDGKNGGTGALADWSRVATLKAQGRKTVLAGGLCAGNIRDAAATGADVLDVNSSIETAPGVKSSALLARLLDNWPKEARPSRNRDKAPSRRDFDIISSVRTNTRKTAKGRK